MVVIACFRRRGAEEGSKLTLSEMGLAGAWAGVMNAPVRQVFERVKGVMQVYTSDQNNGEKRRQGEIRDTPSLLS